MRGRKPKAKPAAPAEPVVVGPWSGSAADNGLELTAPDFLIEHDDDLFAERRAILATARFDEIVAEMRTAGTLARVNSAHIEIAAAAYAEWRLAEAAALKRGLIVVVGENDHPIRNPWKDLANAALKNMLTFDRELGLTPVERGRATPVKRQTKKKTAADAYLSGGKNG